MRNKTYPENAIPLDVASQLCNQISQQYRGKWYTLAGMQCWGCTTFSKGDTSRMCFHNAAGYRGCNLVNTRYDKPALPQNT